MRRFGAVVCFLVCALPLQAQRFWNAERLTEAGVFAAGLATDGWATQKAIHMGGFVERNPLARPLIDHGIQGQAAASLLGFSVGLVPSYLLHRSGHRKLSRWWLRVAAGTEAANAISMVIVVQQHVPR